ncbi:hypothetical protein FRB99_001147 [Tulasnella sp. 403]|nr:hypothetical protein FRB99_001147 [Tulasnella sp. 403]
MARPPLARTFSEEEARLTSPPSPLSVPHPLPQDVQYTQEPPDEKRRTHEAQDEEETAALLPDGKPSRGVNRKHTGELRQSRSASSPIGLLWSFALAMFLAAMLLGAGWWLYDEPAIIGTSEPTQAMEILSNGTHDFRRTVLVVSLDGLRAEYVDRNLTTHLHDISLKGLRAKYMEPVFPSLTFPNHWALMTGLFAESHGIVANLFFDPKSGKSFRYSDPSQSWDASWWFGEPVWETAEKAGLRTANLMWPGPPVTSDGHSPTYYVPFENHVPMQWKHDQIFQWLDLPLEKRPQLITAYEPSVDQIGHKYGPSAPEVDEALKAVDVFARQVHSSLAARNLSHIVDVIFVSDHGMVDTSDLRLVYMDDVLGKDGWAAIEHNDGWPSYGLRFKQGTNCTEMLRRLYNAEASYTPLGFDVYVTHSFYEQLQAQSITHVDGHRIVPMPERYHYTNNIRIAPIYIVPKLGWALTHRDEHLVMMNGKYEPKGNHGYDPTEPAMHAMFVADGPFSKATQAMQNAGGPSKPLVMKGFKNVELYGLVVKLLGIQGAKTNGTEGFWDNWVDAE